MLRKITYQVASMFLLVNFLAASTGLSIYFHRCSCEQRLITTLFVEHKCHEEQVSSCCALEEKENSIKESNCGCKTEHLIVKVNDLFNSVNPTDLNTKVDFNKVQLIYNNEIFLKQFSQNFIIDNKVYLPDDSPPIKLSGKKLIIQLHQSKESYLLS